MSPSDDDDEGLYSSSSSYESLSNKDGANNLQLQSSAKDVEDGNLADDTGSQVTFETIDMADTDFLTPGGLNSFSVIALPEKREKLLLKDLPKSIKPSGLSKKNSW